MTSFNTFLVKPTALALLLVCGGAVVNAASLFGDEESPAQEAEEGLQTLDETYKGIIDGIEKDARELSELKEMSPERARERVETTINEMRQLLDKVKPGGTVETATRGAVDWARANQEGARNSTAMTSDERQEIERLWSEQIMQLTQRRARLETIRGTLEAELARLAGAVDYLSHLEMIKTAEAMNLAVERIIEAMNGALTTLRAQNIPVATTEPIS